MKNIQDISTLEFCVYKYEFEKSEQKHLFYKNQELTPELVRQKWGESLRHTLPLQKEVKGELIPVFAQVLEHHDDVALLMVHNVKKLKQWEVMAPEPKDLESFPHCLVLVDNRKGAQQILIEKNSSFGKPNIAMKMLERYITGLLSELEYSVKLFPKVQAGELWDVVEGNKNMGKPATKFTMILRNTDQMDVSSDDAFGIVRATSIMQQAMGEAYTKIETYAKDKKIGLENFMQRTQDMIAFVRLAENNGYDMKVLFANGQPYERKNGKSRNLPAIHRIAESAINNFKDKQLTLDGNYALLEIFDAIRTDNKAYKYVELPPERKSSAKGNSKVVATA